MVRERKVRVVFDVFDDGRVSLKIEGELDPGLLADLVARFAPSPAPRSDGRFSRHDQPSASHTPPTTVMERIKFVIESFFPDRWFTSADVAAVYREVFGEHVALSTVSTYLNRLYRRGLLRRDGNRLRWRYLLCNVLSVRGSGFSQTL